MQDEETRDQGASTYISPADLQDARSAPATKRKYESCRNVIKGWIKGDLAKEEEKLKRDGKRFLDASGEIIGTQFIPAYFDEFLARKRTSVTVSTLKGYRSAMLDLYNRQRVSLPDDYDQDMAYLFSGMQRDQTTHDQTSGAGTSGKEPLPYSLYKELSEKTLVRGDGGIMHLYLTAQWNLTCRSASVETLCAQHLASADDNISAVFYKTKTDQEGKRPKHPRHMYANPANPATCVITALAVYLACHSTLADGPLFPGSDQKKRFSGALRKYFGGKRKKTPFGTHSIRKGSATFACGGSTCGPSLSAVCNRCDWSLGSVLDRYLRYEQAGDPPYAAINPNDLRKEVRNTFYEWRRFMTRIMTEIQKTTKTPVPRIRSELQAEGLFKIGMSSIPLKQSSRKRRCAQLTLTTTLRRAREAKYESNPDYCPKAFVPRKKKTAGSTIGREDTTSRAI